ncbi:hypothetical protein HW555_010369, partial [Spodoptera exigua]
KHFDLQFHVNVYAVVISLWVLKNVFYVMIFGISCEQFYISIRNVKSSCYENLKHHQNIVDAELASGYISLEVKNFTEKRYETLQNGKGDG